MRAGRVARSHLAERARIELTAEPARRLTRSERASIADEAERIGAFLGLEPVLDVR